MTTTERGELERLVEDLEKAGPEQERELVGDAIQYAVENGWMTADKFQHACEFMIAGAYLNAALLTVPERWHPLMMSHANDCFTAILADVSDKRRTDLVTAKTFALALVTASIRALTAQEIQK